MKFKIGQLSIYNQDGDDNPPAQSMAFREWIGATDADLFVTPERQHAQVHVDLCRLGRGKPEIVTRRTG